MANPPIPAPPLADSAASTPSLRTLGTGSQQAAAGNDSRLSTPTNAQTTPAANKIPLADGSGVIAPAWLVDASASTAGKVSTSAQTFAGLKTFQNGIETSSLSVGLSSPAGRVHVLSESNSNTPTSFTTNHLVVGRAASTGANSGAVFIQYNSTGNEGLIGSLSPAVAWRNLRLAAANVLVSDPAGNTPISLSNTGTATAVTYTSSAASGANAFTASTSGARLSLGDTSKYFWWDAGNAYMTFEGGWLNATAGFITNSGLYTTRSNATATLSGNVADSASSVATILKSAVTYTTAGSKLVSVRNANTEVASVDKDGALSALSYATSAASGANAISMVAGSRLVLDATQPTRYLAFGGSNQADFVNLLVTAGLGFSAANGVYQTSGGSTASINGVVTDGATAVATILRSNGTLSTAGAKITSFRSGTSEKAFVDKDGLISADSFVATTATGDALTGGGASGPLIIASNTPDSHTSSTVPAIRLKANQSITTGDLLLSVENSTGARRFSVFENGGVQTDVRVTTPEVNSGGGLLLRASAGSGNAHTIRADGSPTNIAVFSTLAGGTQASISLAGDVTGKSFSSTAASGAYAFSAPTGSRISLGNTSSYIDHNGSNQFTFNESLVAASAGFTTAGMFQTYGNTTATLNGVVADAANAVATVLRSNSAYTTAGAKITSFRSGTTEIASIDKDGAVSGLSFNSAATSGSNAITFTNTGARLSLGNTSRYLYDTGSEIAINNKLTITGETTQFPNALNIAATTHATSRRAGAVFGDWAFGQDASGNGTKDFFLYDGATAANRLYIATNGNVGIGTTTPSSKLDVNGKTNTTQLSVGGGATFTELDTVTQTWNAGTVANLAGASTTVTFTGAAVGDVVAAAYDAIGSRTIFLTANVSSANNVRVNLFNLNGANVTLSGTLRIFLIKA